MYPKKAWSTRKRKAASAVRTPFCLHILVSADVLRVPSARHRALTDVKDQDLRDSGNIIGTALSRISGAAVLI